MLRKKEYCHRLAKATAKIMAHHDLSRRDFPNWLADTIYGFEGQVFGPDGEAFDMPDTLIDDAFNDDGSFRWLSDFLKLKDRLPKQRPQHRILPRLRLIELALKIDHQSPPTDH